MNCPDCKHLHRMLESTQLNYLAARSGAFYRVSTKIAAKKQVDMERAKSDLQEHELVCSPEADTQGIVESHGTSSKDSDVRAVPSSSQC